MPGKSVFKLRQKNIHKLARSEIYKDMVEIFYLIYNGIIIYILKYINFELQYLIQPYLIYYL